MDTEEGWTEARAKLHDELQARGFRMVETFRPSGGHRRLLEAWHHQGTATVVFLECYVDHGDRWQGWELFIPAHPGNRVEDTWAALDARLRGVGS